MKKVILNAFALLLVFSQVSAQISTPAASPGAEFSTTVGLTDITINYSRPGVKDRTVFAADGLVPYGKTWRTGANGATKISFSDDVTFGGKEVPAGDYAMLTTPGERTWIIMLFTYEARSWSSYNEKEADYTFDVKPVTGAPFVETFTINIADVKNESAHLDLMWETTVVQIPIQTEVHDRVMANIREVMSGPSAGEYYTAATYIHENGNNPRQALEYIQLANEDENARYWWLRREALILADLEMYTEAIAKATTSMNMADKAGNVDFVRMNKESIDEWSGK